MKDKDKLVDFLKSRLASYYEKVKLTDQTNETEAQYINGIMASIRILGLLEKVDIKDLIEAAHYQVFAISYEERQIGKALNDGGEHWDIFEIPTVRRQRK